MAIALSWVEQVRREALGKVLLSCVDVCKYGVAKGALGRWPCLARVHYDAPTFGRAAALMMALH
eukprot:1846942-Alexandrium_andersonii.AAC.1